MKIDGRLIIDGVALDPTVKHDVVLLPNAGPTTRQIWRQPAPPWPNPPYPSPSLPWPPGPAWPTPWRTLPWPPGTPFAFTAQTGVARNTVVTSNTVTPTDYASNAPISVAGGSYSIDGGAFVTTPGSISPGQTVAVRQTSSASFSTATELTLTIGWLAGTFSVTTGTGAVVNCVLGDWSDWVLVSDWSPCVSGTRSKQEERTRQILTQPANGGMACGPRIETRTISESCTPIPDPVVYYAITGTITVTDTPLQGVTFTVSAPAVCPATNGSGNFTCTVPAGWSGIITPALSGYTFTPAYRSYSNVVANDGSENFAATSTSVTETVWVEDAAPTGAGVTQDNDAWNWISSSPSPFSGSLAHRSNIVVGDGYQAFYSATTTLSIGTDNILFTYVYVDAGHIPTRIALQWQDSDGSWSHLAYWGTQAGVDATYNRFMGAVPASGSWIRLEVPAASVDLEGKTLTGMIFHVRDGRVTWDKSGKAVIGEVIVDPPIPTDELPMPSLADEQATYVRWGWTYAAPVFTEPVFSASNPPYFYSFDIHGTTEGDDLWTYLMMFRRTGNPIFQARMLAAVRYFKSDYRNSIGQAGDTYNDDKSFGLDHLYGWGLIDWYLHSGDTEALAAAKLIGDDLNTLYQPNSYYGCATYGLCLHYQLRGGARHLLFLSRLAEFAPEYIGLRDKVANYMNTAPEWDADYGTFWIGRESTNDFLGWLPNAYDGHGARIQAPWHLGIVSEALYHYWRTTGASWAKDKIVAIANFVDDYGLSSESDYAGYRFGVIDGGKYHSYDGSGFWDVNYTISLVGCLVYGYKLSGDAALLARAKYFFNRGTKGVQGSPTLRSANDTTVGHWIDSIWDSSGYYFGINNGELQYCYRIFENGGLPTVEVAVTPPGGAPTDPSSLVATVNGETQITLTWHDNSSDETGFAIERAQIGATGFTQFVITAANVVTYVDSGRLPGTQYQYKLRAVKGAVYSNYIASLVVTTDAQAVTTYPLPTPTPSAAVPTYLAGLAVDAWREVANTNPSAIASSADASGVNGARGFAAWNGQWRDRARSRTGSEAGSGHGDGWWNGGYMIDWTDNAPQIVQTSAGSSFSNVIDGSDGYYRDGKFAGRHKYYQNLWHELLGGSVHLGCINPWSTITGNGGGPWLDIFYPDYGVHAPRGTLPFMPMVMGADASVCINEVTGWMYAQLGNQMARWVHDGPYWDGPWNMARQFQFGPSANDWRRRRNFYAGVPAGSATGPCFMDENTFQFYSVNIVPLWSDQGTAVEFWPHPTTPSLDAYIIRDGYEGGGRLWKVSNLDAPIISGTVSWTVTELSSTGGSAIPAPQSPGGGLYSRFSILTDVNGCGYDIAVIQPTYAGNAWVRRMR